MKDCEQNCVLLLEKMAATPYIELDVSTGSMLGEVTMADQWRSYACFSLQIIRQIYI